MDLHKLIQELCAEKEKLDRAIALLEGLEPPKINLPDSFQRASRRGRKSMDAKERQEVSARMKQYWASRRAQKSVVGYFGSPAPCRRAAVCPGFLPS
jgi:hypothetical protein